MCAASHNWKCGRFPKEEKQLKDSQNRFDRKQWLLTCQSRKAPGTLRNLLDAFLVISSGFFSRKFYLRHNPDVRAGRTSSLYHFLRCGWYEGRDPGPKFNLWHYLEANPDVRQIYVNPLLHYLRQGREEGRTIQHVETAAQWLKRHYSLSESDRDAMRRHIEAMEFRPIVSICMPTYNTDPLILRQAIGSVRNQIYTKWELCICDDASTRTDTLAVLREAEMEDERIVVHYRQENGHISASSNDALSLATGEFVGLIDHDDVLAEHAVYMVADALNRQADANLIYSDEAVVQETGEVDRIHFKPDYNRELLLAQNYVCHFMVVRKGVIDRVGGFRQGFEGSQDHDLVLRIVKETGGQGIVHIPHVLYYWRMVEGSTAASSKNKEYAIAAGLRAADAHLKSLGIRAEVQIDTSGRHRRIRYELPMPPPRVSLVVVAGGDSVDTIVNGLVKTTEYADYEIVIAVPEGCSEQAARMAKEISTGPLVTVFPYQADSGYPTIVNAAVSACRGEVLGILDEGIEGIHGDWLQEMAGVLLQENVGVVGAKLLYPGSSRMKHCGYVLGVGGVVGHDHQGTKDGASGYYNRLNCARDVSAVSGACLLVRKSVFEEVGGLDAESPAGAYWDVDLCLKVQGTGHRVVWTPNAKLYCHECDNGDNAVTDAVCGQLKADALSLREKWREFLLDDPYYNPNLSLESIFYARAEQPRTRKPWDAYKGVSSS